MNDTQAVLERSGGALYCRAAVVDGSVSEEERSVDFIVSTEDIDGHGTIVRQNWRLDRYNENPVVLYAHEHDDLPIGTASEVRVDGGKLRAKVTFSTEDLNPKAEQVWKNVKAKIVRGISAGFWPHSVTFERHDDREVVVLDDNELWEMSVCPVPSNPNALAELRTLASKGEPRGGDTAALGDQATTKTPPTDGPADPTPEPIGTERDQEMSEQKTTLNPAPVAPAPVTPSIARALGLPAGAPESECIAAAARQRELEVQIMTITESTSSSEALGAVRGLQVAAARCRELEERLVTLEGERDAQNFDSLIAQARADRKLTPAMIQQETQTFQEERAAGRGSRAVEQLRGRLKVAVPIPNARYQEPEARISPQNLEHNGKSYGDLSYKERAALAKRDPELWRLMKDDYEAQRRSA